VARRSEPADRRVLSPAAIAVFGIVASGGLAVLRLGASAPRPELVEPGRDPLTMAYLRVFVAGHPDDAAMRVKLSREELALGRLRQADHTLTPLLADARAPDEVVQLSLECSLEIWRAAPTGTPERGHAEAQALARLESLLRRSPTVDLLTRVSVAARELGRPDLAARAGERAADLDRARCSAWLASAAHDFLSAADPASSAAALRHAYDCARDDPAARALALDALDAQVAADRAADALGFAERLVQRFPEDTEILGRAEVLALANADPARARRFAARLGELGAADDRMLEHLLDLDLAAGDLAAALGSAERLVQRAPSDRRLRRLGAQVADWAGRPRLGLPHRMWLARYGDALDLAQALRLAHSLDDDAALAELLTLQARHRALGAGSLTELAGALERLGSPGQAVAVLENAARHSTGDAIWEVLAAFHERRRDLPAAIAAITELVQRDGASLPRSLRLARLQWTAGHPDAALAELGGRADAADRADTEYWQLLAELAWQQESDELAERAYRVIWQDEAIDAVGAERLVILSREAGRPADAIRYGREGWERLGEPRLLLLAMDEAARARRWDALARLRREAARDEPRFAGSLAYWLLCGQLDERDGRVADAARDYRRALAIDGGAAAARSGLLWLLIDHDDRAGLAAQLGTWTHDAEVDPGLWRAYAAGLDLLGRPREALVFFQREADADPDDDAARARYLAAVHRAAAPARATPAAAPSPTVIAAEVGVTTLGPAVLRRLGASARTDVRGAALEVRSVLTQVAADDPMLRLDHSAVDLLAGATLAALGGRAEIFGGASVQRDGAVPRAALAYTRMLGPRAQAGLEAMVNDAAPESAVLLAEAVRTRAGGSLGLGSARFYGRLAGEWKTWSTRSGTWLARGGAGALELGVHARLADPEVNLRLTGGYQRNELAMAMPGAPILPDQLVTLGVGASAAGWNVGPARLVLDAWLGEMAPPHRLAYRFQSGLATTPFPRTELSLTGYVANDSWMIGHGGLGMTASLAYRFPNPEP
jgi:tetratricopeptide (TPR) repeat protein